MINKIRSHISNYSNFQKSLNEQANNIRTRLIDNKYKFFCEDKNLYSIPDDNINFSVGASDSGFFNESLCCLDFVYVKSAGSYIKYKNNKIVDYNRIPKTTKKELYFSESILQKEDVTKFASIHRICEELEVLDKILKEKNPEYLLIDGPILPQPIDRPANTSILYKGYVLMLEKFVGLYDACKDASCTLLACTEDSRAQSFINLSKEPAFRVNDTYLLNSVLKHNEGLSFFKIFSAESNVINQDLEKYGKFNFYSSYLKLNDDYPLRVETTSTNFKDIRKVVKFMSGGFKDYCYPSAIIDADKQAKLTPKEIDSIRSLVYREFDKINIKKLRRKRRI